MTSNARDFVRPSEIAEYNEVRASLLAEIHPATAIERVYADEIVTATWRLRRCATLEASLGDRNPNLDPMENPEAAALQIAIDRGRALANRILRLATQQLRDLRRDRPTNMAPPVAVQPPAAEPREFTIQTRTDAPTSASMARNARCHCGSGQKFKRCCGLNAPAVLGRAA